MELIRQNIYNNNMRELLFGQLDVIAISLGHDQNVIRNQTDSTRRWMEYGALCTICPGPCTCIAKEEKERK
jgi:hypothetical protein